MLVFFVLVMEVQETTNNNSLSTFEVKLRYMYTRPFPDLTLWDYYTGYVVVVVVASVFSLVGHSM